MSWRHYNGAGISVAVPRRRISRTAPMTGRSSAPVKVGAQVMRVVRWALKPDAVRATSYAGRYGLGQYRRASAGRRDVGRADDRWLHVQAVARTVEYLAEEADVRGDVV
jgi:hypothetical protein